MKLEFGLHRNISDFWWAINVLKSKHEIEYKIDNKNVVTAKNKTIVIPFLSS